MPISETPERIVTPGLGLSWGPAIAGAIAATALAFVLDSFGVAIGLALSSVSPTWRDTSFALVLLSGLYLVLAALASYGLGGYIAGRMRRQYDPGELPEFQDGMHGLLVWGIATLLAGLIAAVTLPLLPRTPGVAAATPNATSSVPGESLIAFALMAAAHAAMAPSKAAAPAMNAKITALLRARLMSCFTRAATSRASR